MKKVLGMISVIVCIGCAAGTKYTDNCESPECRDRFLNEMVYRCADFSDAEQPALWLDCIKTATDLKYNWFLKKKADAERAAEIALQTQREREDRQDAKMTEGF